MGKNVAEVECSTRGSFCCSTFQSAIFTVQIDGVSKGEGRAEGEGEGRKREEGGVLGAHLCFPCALFAGESL